MQNTEKLLYKARCTGIGTTGRIFGILDENGSVVCVFNADQSQFDSKESYQKIELGDEIEVHRGITIDEYTEVENGKEVLKKVKKPCLRCRKAI